ncbi:calcineurin B homologous protein 2 isoform X1 [Sphaeramia orbicularis]|uniref:calcineurin B homologous protein 2 isoform X1 n=1 Tax=Sphaeramia orbicularis TaxID=375764 RepID=UPI00117C52BA|nr:calcineurin B homologous protein 2-like isoform X1 [Sphaeramia orbicularis]
MGSSSSRLDRVPGAKDLMEETGFSETNILCLYDRFEVLDREERGYLRLEDFEAIQQLAVNPIGDRIIGAFVFPGRETLDFPSFVRVLAHFRPTDTTWSRSGSQPEPANSRTRKLRFAFSLYDQDGDGKISRAELTEMLQAMLGMQVTDEQLQSIVGRAIQEADLDRDGAISFDEFKKMAASGQTGLKSVSSIMYRTKQQQQQQQYICGEGGTEQAADAAVQQEVKVTFS